MAEAGTLHDAFIDELRDTYDAERQLTKALAKLAKAASSAPRCARRFESHLVGNPGSGRTPGTGLRGCSTRRSAREAPAHGIAGIIEEGKSDAMEGGRRATTRWTRCLIAAGAAS